jgi:predicted GIY-YIG superfamily endonuclease
MRGGYVYIMANRQNGAIYVGVASVIAARATQHRNGEGSDFCRRYGLKRLVYVEPHATIVGYRTRKAAEGLEAELEGGADRRSKPQLERSLPAPQCLITR